jgi:uncharacterized protein YutE (UPF0331/DUF86 family)
MLRLNKAVIFLKMKNLAQYLGELEPLTSVGVAEYQKDYVKRHAVEKLVELIVEIASDINRDIIEAEQGEPATSYFSTFSQLGELKILSKKLSDRLASTAGLRNRLVHHYEDIEHKIVYLSAGKMLKDYHQYFQLIEKYLQAH